MSTVSVDGFIVVSKALESGLRKKGGERRLFCVLVVAFRGAIASLARPLGWGWRQPGGHNLCKVSVT